MINKEQLYQFCADWAQAKIDSIQTAIDSAQASANSETKSTSGDKHDTARAMMQLDVEQKSKQLAEAQKNKIALSQFTAKSGTETISLGSFVETSGGFYYISVSVGKIEIDSEIVFGISPISPIAQVMKGLKAGEHFTFNGRQINIISID